MYSCQEQQTIGIINGAAKPGTQTIHIGRDEVPVNQDGTFQFEVALNNATIFTINHAEEVIEVYLKPGATVTLDAREKAIVFEGDLQKENNHLLTDKKLNEAVGPYLTGNWYSLHRAEEAVFIAKMDSLKQVFIANMDGTDLSEEFVTVNTASVNYAFDRLVLRYPRTHFYFTGESKPLSAAVKERLAQVHDAPQYLHIDSYQKFVQTWIDAQLAETDIPENALTYHGEIMLKAALHFVETNFTSQVLKEYWSLVYLQKHIENYAWINGEEHLHAFIQVCQTLSVLQDAVDFRESELAKRRGHEILLYKTARGQKLEAHIFKPVGFDAIRQYKALAAFHGGGWISGNAGWTFSSAEHAAARGLIGIAVEYRLSNRDDVTPVEAMSDVRDLFRWLRVNAEEFNIQPDSIVGKGISAGGHLVSSVTVLPHDPVTVPNALVLVSPALDTSDEYFRGLINSDVTHQELSSVENLSAAVQVPPTLILQGETDRLTPTKYAVKFQSKMDSLGYQCELVRYPGVGHLFTPSHLDDTGWPQTDPAVMKQAIARQDEFLRELGYID